MLALDDKVSYYLEYKKGNSNKFWRIEKDIEKLTYEVQWGKINSKGCGASYGPFPTLERLNLEFSKKVQLKLDKGYEVIGCALEATSPIEEEEAPDDSYYIIELD